MASKDYDAELALPSVIIHMPELRRMAARKKALAVMLSLMAVLIFVALSNSLYQEVTERPIEIVKAETLEVKNTAEDSSLKLTVKILPENVVHSAVVEVDGNVISGNPPSAYLKPSENYHSIKISAPGYEVMSKDVQVAQNEVMTFSLIALNAPVVADAQMDEGIEADDGEGSQLAQGRAYLIEEIENDSNGALMIDSGKGKAGKGAGRRAAAAGDREKGDGNGEREGYAGNAAAGGSNIAHLTTASRRASANAGADAPEGVRAHGAEASGSNKRASAAAMAPSSQADTLGAASADGATVSSTASSGITTVPAMPLGTPSANTGGEIAAARPRTSSQSAKASLIVNAPLGVSSRIRVSVDGQMRGYLPVLLKVDAGLHELTFMTEGRRTFQMVKLNPGQIVRIIPNL